MRTVHLRLRRVCAQPPEPGERSDQPEQRCQQHHLHGKRVELQTEQRAPEEQALWIPNDASSSAAEQSVCQKRKNARKYMYENASTLAKIIAKAYVGEDELRREEHSTDPAWSGVDDDER